MACIAAIGINDEKDVLANLSNRLYSDFAVISTGILLLQCGVEKDTCSIIEADPSLGQSAAAFGLVPYALSVHDVNS